MDILIWISVFIDLLLWKILLILIAQKILQQESKCRNGYFVSGNASKITTQIFRIFDSDGNDFLDFKEFLMAIDVANRTTGGKIWEEKPRSVSHHQMRRNCDGLSGCTTWTTTGWSIWRRCLSSSRLWIALRASNLVSCTADQEATVKNVEGVIRYDENGNPQTIASTRQRAEEIFKVSKTSC